MAMRFEEGMLCMINDDWSEIGKKSVRFPLVDQFRSGLTGYLEQDGEHDEKGKRSKVGTWAKGGVWPNDTLTPGWIQGACSRTGHDRRVYGGVCHRSW